MKDTYEILCEIRALSQGDEQSIKAKRIALQANPAKIQEMCKAASVKTLRQLFARADRFAENTGH
jgi:hypothetical protein